MSPGLTKYFLPVNWLAVARPGKPAASAIAICPKERRDHLGPFPRISAKRACAESLFI